MTNAAPTSTQAVSPALSIPQSSCGTSVIVWRGAGVAESGNGGGGFLALEVPGEQLRDGGVAFAFGIGSRGPAPTVTGVGVGPLIEQVAHDLELSFRSR